MLLRDRGVIITGASQGLGKAIAQACIQEGAHVMLCARGESSLEKARAALVSLASPSQKVVSFSGDVSREADVARLFESSQKSLPQIDALVNNAGIYGPKGPVEEVSLADWWRTMEINLLGTLLTCREVLHIFRRRGYGKIVNLSGGGATAPLPRFSAYAASKAAVVRFTETLAHETREARIDVNALAPGALNTRMLDEVLAEGPTRVGHEAYERALRQKEEGGAPIPQAAALCAFLLSSSSDGITGRLISAVWDPWKTLASHIEELRNTDIYTLRRILPEDRGMKWE
jgi:NAD(P)-dependent dehydrogenase (short-subunit alcohol dehydrogenase family)